jgi:hypothetical protein
VIISQTGWDVLTGLSFVRASNPNMTLAYAETDEQAKRDAVRELAQLIFPKLA